MGQTNQVDPELLFKQEDLSLEDIVQLKSDVYASVKTRRKFEKELASFYETKAGKLSSTSKAQARKGVACWLINKLPQATELLEKARTSKETDYFLALCYLGSNRPLQAHDLFKKWYQDDPDSLLLTMSYVDAKIKTDQIEEAFELLKKIKARKNFRHNADIYFYTGLCLEYFGRYKEAETEYQNALRVNSKHQPTLFRMAWNADLSGYEEEALELYQTLMKLKPTNINTAINLGLMYEDKGEYDKAIKCYERVLEYYPTHPRGLLYLKDSQAAQTMYYDEQLKRREQRLAQILSIPISDFQLSVRSRACLEKLGVRSLGDMTKWTEPGLLKTENFGMTSLAEIKELLARHGLTLSQEEFTLPESTQPAVSSTQSTTDLLNKPLSEFEWSARTKGCMARMKLYIVGDLTKHTEAELLAVQNFGQTSLTEVKQRLNLLGLVLKLPE